MRVRQRNAPRKPEVVSAGRHPMHTGFPHLSTATGACMCDGRCCFGVNGCLCRACSGAGHAGCKRKREASERK